MPLFGFKCPKCEKSYQLFLTPEQGKQEQKCKEDGDVMVRVPRTASTQVKEIVDGGYHPRRVEIIKKP